MTPQRIQRKNTKGWHTPQGALYVGRGTRYGNPYLIGESYALIASGPYGASQQRQLLEAITPALPRGHSDRTSK